MSPADAAATATAAAAERAAALTRRRFLQSSGVAAGVAGGLPLAGCAASGAADLGAAPSPASGESRRVVLRVNGARRELQIEARVTLLDALREGLALNGTKKGCDRGQCGACTVLVDGRRINACLTLAVMHEDAEITTIEGLGTPAALHPMQAAFIEHDGFQCGYCTPGQICSAVAYLAETRAAAEGRRTIFAADGSAAPAAAPGTVVITDAAIKEGMSGNLCRCGAYPNIVAAVRSVGSAAPS